MPTTFLDFSFLTPFVGVLATFTTLAVFDLYVFSPRPCGIAKRSRELAPSLVIAISMGVAALSLHLHSSIELNGLVINGANDAMHTLQGERIRLLSYPLVVTSVFESLLLGFVLLGSAYFLVAPLGLLGWSVVFIAITIFTGTAAVISNANGINFGPFELAVGLGFASTYVHSRNLPCDRRRWIELALLMAIFAAASVAGILTESPVRVELLLVAVLSGVATSALLMKLNRISGPHWEATSLYFVSALAVFVLAGFSLALAPHVFDGIQWQKEVAGSRVAIKIDLEDSLASLEMAVRLTPESEIAFAERLAVSAVRLRYLASHTDGVETLTADDQRTLSDLKRIERMLRILERLHLSRGLVADVERRTSAAVISATEKNYHDPMAKFWKQNRPWIQNELELLKNENNQAETKFLFVESMEADLDRLTRAAIEVEIHRVDGWVDWATRQPRESVPTLKQTANAQIVRLDALLKLTETAPLPKDSRFYSLHRNLRKMASVSESKWE